MSAPPSPHFVLSDSTAPEVACSAYLIRVWPPCRYRSSPVLHAATPAPSEQAPPASASVL
eukprot:6376437-Pyramimonas_sp.AAC.1